MAQYTISYPIAGVCRVYVEADSDEEALEKGWDVIGNDDSDLEWEAYRRLVSGNVTHFFQNEVEIEFREEDTT